MMFNFCPIRIHSVRQLSKYALKDKSSKVIRQRFLDYFIRENSHDFVKSSPVVPFCDPSLAFVNAGMNQFKNIFLGSQTAPHKKVANSQKCVRVGGKHNDINVVGSDGYHHTFFEMLGNWSFGDYFKKEACELAWKLLTEEYKINPARLYVTYFKGDPNLKLPPDLETKEIWKSIGVPENRILPFGPSENFWEMGPVGPCGPCTEIHIDHYTAVNRAKLVNKGLHDLTELWNIVFIQYNRNAENSIDLLPENHVDTGMGFERLTAFLQGKISNYDTDNFTYLLEAINKNCKDIPKYQGKFGENDWDSLDQSYRILADHARMITVCLADGMIPESNQKLRRVMRKAFLLSETVFMKEKGLLKELSNYVIEQLGCVYKEMESNAKQIHQIIDYEEDVYNNIRKTAADEWKKLVEAEKKFAALDVIETPSIVSACKDIMAIQPKIIDKELGFKLYDRFGLDVETINKIATTFNIKVDQKGLAEMLEKSHLKSQEQSSLNTNVLWEKINELNVPKTERLVYEYTKCNNKYNFIVPNVKVLKIIKDNEFVPEIRAGKTCFVVLDKSNFYIESGGQMSDRGEMLFKNSTLDVENVLNCNGYVLHECRVRKGGLKTGDSGKIVIDPVFRLNNMRNHTATHLLNATLRNIKGAVCQKSSKVTNQYLNLDLAVFSEKLSNSELQSVEEKILHLIKKRLNVIFKVVDSQNLLNLDDVTVIPGEIYPESDIRLIEIFDPEDGFISREPCCGTHVLNTADLDDFAIVNVKSLGRSTTSLYAVTGDRAKAAHKNAQKLLKTVDKLQSKCLNIEDAQALKDKLNFNVEDEEIVTHVAKHEALEKLNQHIKTLKDVNKNTFQGFVEEEMRKARTSKVINTKNNQKYLIHFIKEVDTEISLQKATRLSQDIPTLLIIYGNNTVKARCCVPEGLEKSFSAEKWLKETVAEIFESKAAVPKGQDGNLVCNMKAKKIPSNNLDVLLNKSVDAAKKYIEERL